MDSAALPWPCRVVEEGRMSLGGREFLYMVGDATMGSACVGAGCLRFVYVPGFVESWQSRRSGAGEAVSLIEPVTDGNDLAAIKGLLAERHPSLQVCF
ncbi:MAG: hypothetical protein JW838_02790 [Spirochaetes bacterium]|nr:hypothetical protein [Spirochaetota bacterium]